MATRKRGPLWVIVDVESDGECPGLYSMVSLGAVALQDPVASAPTFKGLFAPLHGASCSLAALSVCGVAREEQLEYPHPSATMGDFGVWLLAVACGRRLVFVSDNPAFDWQFANYYFHRFQGRNPFGHSARRIGDLYSGLVRDARKGSEWKRLRQTRHTHDPVDDARGNAEALIVMGVRSLGVDVDPVDSAEQPL